MCTERKTTFIRLWMAYDFEGIPLSLFFNQKIVDYVSGE
jgi:hypothetical protein